MRTDKAILANRLLDEIKAERVFGSPFATIFENKTIRTTFVSKLKTRFESQGLYTNSEAVLQAFISADHILDPLALFRRALSLYFRDQKIRDRLDGIAMGMALSYKVRGVAVQGKHDEIAIVIDSGVLDLAHEILGLVVGYFVNTTNQAKPEELRQGLYHAISTYGQDKQPSNANSSLHDVNFCALDCATEFLLFCALHEVGHVLLGHFERLASTKGHQRDIRLAHSHEMEADRFALEKWFLREGKREPEVRSESLT